MNTEQVDSLYAQFSRALEGAGIHPVSDDTAARLLAIVYVYGGSMELGYNAKLMTDLRYAQRRAGLLGGETPDADLVKAMNGYIRDIESVLRAAPRTYLGINVETDAHPEWVRKFMLERYGIPKMHV